MRKKIIVLIIVALTAVNVLASMLLYTDLITMKAPDTTVNIKIIKINSEEIVISSTVDLYNPNDFELIVKNLKLDISTPLGEKVSEFRLSGGRIEPNQKKTFTKNFSVDFSGSSPDILKTSLTGSVGIKSWFVTKTLPISINVITEMSNSIEKLSTPNVNVRVSFGEITQRHINISLVASLYNPNTFELSIEDIQVTAKTEKGEVIGEMLLSGGVLGPESPLNLSGNGTIIIQALNAKEIIVNMSTYFTATIAGYNKSLPLFVESIVDVPDLKTLLPSVLPTSAILRGDMKFSLRGLVDEITLEVDNPNKIEFVAKDITFTMYRIDKNTKQLIGECGVENGVFKAEAKTLLTGTMVIPYRALFVPPPGGKILPDWLELEIKTNVTVSGLNNYIWMGLYGYSDLHPFRVDKVYTSPEIIE